MLRALNFPGGKGANVSVAAARILGKRKVAFLGALGDDSIARPLRDSLDSEGVNTEGVVFLEGKSSGRAYIVVDENGRKIIHTHFGVNEALLPSHLDSSVARSLFASSSLVVAMDPPISVIEKATSLARRAGVRLVLSPGVRTAERERLTRVLRVVNDLVVDRSELTALAGVDEPAGAIAVLSRNYPHLNIVATLGPEGSIISSGGSSSSIPPVDLSNFGLKAVNSTGSGDAFLAGYACYSLFGSTPKEAAEWGNLAGALKATSLETRGSASRQVLESRMHELKELKGRRQGSPSSTI